MGYRNYIWVVNKTDADPIRNMNSTEFKDQFLAEDNYFSLFDLRDKLNATEALELGKYAPHDEVSPYLSNFFTNLTTNITANNPDQELNILDIKALDKLCKYYKDEICEYYTKLVEEGSLIKLQTEFKQLISWLNIAIEDVDNKYILTDSWRYDHAIFNFIYLKKVFNPETQYLIWVGY